MLAINLLPPEEKRVVRTRELCRAVLLCTVLAVGVWTAGLALLVPSFFSSYLVRRELEDAFSAAEQEASQRGVVRETLAEAKKTKAMVAEVNNFLLRPGAGAPLLEKFFAAGKGIELSTLLIRADGTVSLEGRAATRDQLLAFEETLRATGLFLEVTFPLSDIVRERDIRFAARATLKSPVGL